MRKVSKLLQEIRVEFLVEITTKSQYLYSLKKRNLIEMILFVFGSCKKNGKKKK